MPPPEARMELHVELLKLAEGGDPDAVRAMNELAEAHGYKPRKTSR